MFNNNVTYNDEHNTEANRKALKTLERKYFDKSECSPDCPVAWAPEVLEMMDTLQAELGFFHNEGTLRGYYIRGNPLDWFLKNPWKELFSSISRNVFNVPTKWERKSGTSVRISIGDRLTAPFKAFFRPIGYGLRAFKVVTINPMLNRFQKNKIKLGQLKEKYGELRCYFNTSDAYSEYVDRQVRKCELKLAAKGVYYPIESLWNSAVSYNVETEYRPDSIEVTYGEYKGERTVSVRITKYRELMKELGMDLKDIQAKAEAVSEANKDKDES